MPGEQAGFNWWGFSRDVFGDLHCRYMISLCRVDSCISDDPATKIS